MRTEFQFGKMKKFWRCMVVMAAQQGDCTSCHWTALLKMVKMVNFMLCIVYHNFLKTLKTKKRKKKREKKRKRKEKKRKRKEKEQGPSLLPQRAPREEDARLVQKGARRVPVLLRSLRSIRGYPRGVTPPQLPLTSNLGQGVAGGGGETVRGAVSPSFPGCPAPSPC